MTMTAFLPAPVRSTVKFVATPARLFALARITLGAWIFLDPAGFGAKWLTPPQDPLLTGLMLRASGGKDVLVGVGLLLADKPRRWLWVCAGFDLIDATIVFFARSRFTDQDLWSGVLGAGSFAILAVAIAEIGARRQRAAANS